MTSLLWTVDVTYLIGCRRSSSSTRVYPGAATEGATATERTPMPTQPSRPWTGPYMVGRAVPCPGAQHRSCQTSSKVWATPVKIWTRSSRRDRRQRWRAPRRCPQWGRHLIVPEWEAGSIGKRSIWNEDFVWNELWRFVSTSDFVMLLQHCGTFWRFCHENLCAKRSTV